MEKSQKKEKRSCYIVYTLLFLAAAGMIWLILSVNNKSLMWSSDGLFQHYIALSYYGKWGREILKNIFVRHTFEIPLWDFHIGYGSDVLTTFHYYVIGDPLNLLSILTPQRYTEYLYNALIFLRMYLAGLSFGFYCFEMKKEKTAVLAGTLTYVFCGYMLRAILNHPFFLNPMICLPLLLAGAERIFRKKNPALFIGMVCLSAASNFYFFYMLVLAVCLYVFVRFFTFRHENVCRELFVLVMKFFGYALVGVCMAAVILLPVLLQFSETSRLDTRPVYELLHPASFYRDFLAKFIIAGKFDHAWTTLGFTAPALLAVFVLFGKRKERTALKVSFLMLTGMLCLPLFGRIFNGFSYVSNRWCFIYAMLVCYIMVDVWEDLFALTKKRALVLLAVCVAYISYLFLDGKKEEAVFYGGLVLASAALMAAAAWKRDLKIRRFVYSGGMACIVLLHVCLNCYASFSGNFGKNKKKDLVERGTAWEQVLATAPYAIRETLLSEEAFCRFEMDEFRIMNSAPLAGVNGTTYYWSLENSAVSKFLMDMKPSVFRVYNYRDLDHRTFLDAIAGVKYFVQNRSDFLPYGYEHKQDVLIGGKTYGIYENQYALPLGYTYKSYIPYESYQNMEPIERQEAFLQGVVLEEEPPVDGIAESRPVFTSRQATPSIVCGENVTRQADGSFAVSKRGGKITLKFSGSRKCETYLWVQGMEAEGKNLQKDEFIPKVSLDGISHNKFRYNTKRHKLYNGQKDFLVNLGYHEEAASEITIRFPGRGTYRFDSLQVIFQPMENYVRQADSLREYTMENEKIGVNTVEGTVDLPEKRILFLSIPYTKGWHATVDGQKTPLMRANLMYLALPLEEGEHEIRLSYRTPGLYPGIAASCVGMLIFVFIARKERRKL